MREQILNVIQALHQNRELIADAYCQAQGVAPDDESRAAFTRLLKVKALSPFVEGSYRLDRRLRVFFDRAINRVKIYGHSTHYVNVVGKLQAMTEAYQAALLAADTAQEDECLDEIVDLCEEFVTGMKEDIEHFRMVVTTRKGFAGGNLKDRLLHNRNYVEQAGQMVEAVGLLDQVDLLDAVKGYATLSGLLRRHLVQRVEGDEDLRRRLFEVQQDLQQALFDLQAAHHLVEVLLRLDDRLSRQTEVEPACWNDDRALPPGLFRFAGWPLPAYLDPHNTPAEDLLPLLHEIADDRRPTSHPSPPRAGMLDDPGAPPAVAPTPDEFEALLAGWLVARQGAAYPDPAVHSAVGWFVAGGGNAVDFWPVIWLGLLSSAIDNGRPPPAGWRFRAAVACREPRWETPVLTDFWLEPDAADSRSSGVA